MKAMDQWLRKAPNLLKKYKYPCLILLLGVFLMLLPVGGQREKTPVSTEPATPELQDPWADYCWQTEKRLAGILSRIQGAGRVEVMLSLKSGQSTQYQTDLDQSSLSEGESREESTSRKTVIFSRGSAYNEPAVVKTDYPVFQGALVVAQGGDDPGVRLALSNAVAALLGLGADQITIVKMK